VSRKLWSIQDIANVVEAFDSSYKVKASVGNGNWANIPWLSILNPKITKTTQDGVYPVYLFNSDGSGFYLSLNQGTTIPTNDLGRRQAKDRAKKIKSILLHQIPDLAVWGSQDIDLNANTVLGRSYKEPNIVAKYYDSENIPADHELKKDLLDLLSLYKKIEMIDVAGELKLAELTHLQPIKNTKNTLTLTTRISKPFVLLAGISGTGKTRFVREQAKASGSLSENYCLTSVRPDWHEPSDLLGYSSRLSGKTEYVITEVLQFIAKAWRAILDSGLTLSADYLGDYGDRLVVSGDKAQLDAVLPYWLCLDEMNLAPVEQYFADYLSVLETREWIWQDDDFQYLCDPLLKASIIHCMDDACLTKLRSDLEFADEQYNDAWELLCQHGIGIPFNLIVAGTVNMDETTHGFSRKVIDRALSFDFGCFFPNDFADYFASSSYNQTLSYPIWSHAKESKSELAKVKADSSGEKSIRFLNEINKVLSNTPFELAYRALNELLLAVICSKPESGTQLNAVLDDFLMFKVLPRIEGDIDKLATGQTKQSIIDELYKLLQVEFSECWYEPKDSPNARPDLYRLKNTEDDKVLRIACRSKAKLEWMQKRLANSGFTSFWP
jgi:hypothetical protein